MIFSDDRLRASYALLETHNRVVPLRDCTTDPCVIMRHDVDYDVTAAMRLADLEEDMGVRSSYFFLTTAPTYNVAAPENRDHLRALHARGFEVGLHFDPLVHDDADDAALAACAQQEAEVLGGIIGEPIRSISVHNPSAHGRYPSFEGFNNAYDPRFYDRDRYLSDSCMGFRDKDPFAMFAAPVTAVT